MTDQGGSVPEIAIQKLNQDHFRRTTGDFSTFRHSFHDTDELADIFRVEATQFSHGTGSGLITGLATDTVSLGHIYLPQETVVRTEIDRDRVCFTLPLDQGEQWKVNGVSGTRSPLFFNTNVDETYIYTKRRDRKSVV